MFSTAYDIFEKFNFSLSNPKNSLVEFAMESAEDELSDWLNGEDLLLGKAKDLNSDDPNFRKQRRIVNAHAYLTVYYVFLSNTQIRPTGTVTTERDETAMSVVSYLKPAEMATLRDEYLRQARNLIAAFSTANFSELVEPPQGVDIISAGKWF